MKKLLMKEFSKSKASFLKFKEVISTQVQRLYKTISAKLKNSFNAIKSYILKIRKKTPVLISQLWQYYYVYKNWFIALVVKYRFGAGLSILAVFVVICWYFYPTINGLIEPYFVDKTRFSNFQSLLIALGSALIGATAIAFSLIMFAMQVNVERMPHGLFRKFSSDPKLLGAFGFTFALAISITILSLLPDKTWVALSVIAAVWCVILIIIFLLIAYKRALYLISPTKQLFILFTDTKKTFRVWMKAAVRTAPLLKSRSDENESGHEQYSSHDMERVAYFQLHPNWTQVAKTSISHCISFARRYAEQGDHEISEAALTTVIAINAAYIEAKGKSFFNNNLFIDNPLSSDDFISVTLEHLRQNVQIGILRGDEQQIGQSLRALERLCLLYLNIDYSITDLTKTHANLAAAYLMGAVESVAPHNMTDVLMDGVRLLGNVAQATISQGDINDITTISKKISLISCIGIVKKIHQPVAEIGISQLSKLTFSLLRNKSHDIKFMLEKVRGDIKVIAEMLLETPETQFSRIHSSILGSYYSGNANTETLMSWLTDLTNAVSELDESNEDAKIIIRHIQQWADNLYQTDKELLLLAIKKKSSLTNDIFHWIIHITKLLLTLANAKACDSHSKDELERSALYLISVISFIPGDEETVRIAEAYQLTEHLFESALDANKRGYFDISIKIRNLFISWAFKAGKYQSGWGSLEHACYGLACLNIIFKLNDDVLLKLISERIVKDDAPSFKMRSQASSRILDTADKHHSGHGSRLIERAMAGVDQSKLRTLLIGIADKLLPEVNSKDKLKK